MKIILSFIFLISGFSTLAQNVGIGVTNPQTKLHAAGSVRFDTLAGSGTRLLYADAAGNILSDNSSTIYQNSQPGIIADAGCTTASGITRTIVINNLPNTVFSANIKVRINITHTFDADLIAFLVAPNGSILNLLSGNGGSGDNFTNTVFFDGAPLAISAGSAPFMGVYRPAGSLIQNCTITPTVTSFGAINGGAIIPNGTWTLQVYDNAMVDAGTFKDWSISFDGSIPSGTTLQNNYEVKSFNGALVNGSIYDEGPGGRIGIGGISAPVAKLQIGGDSALLRVGNSGGNYGNKNIISVAGDGAVSVDASGIPGGRFYIDGLSGNVGIGNPIPLNKLSVAGTVQENGLILSNGGSAGDFLIKSDGSGTVTNQKGSGGLGLNYIIALQGIFPGQGGGSGSYPDLILGEVRLFAGNFAPNGFAFCNGQLLSVNSNTALFALLGTTYGGNGLTNFALPDLRGSVPVHAGISPAGSNWTLGEKH